MTTTGADRLYELLPAVYRERDAEHGYPLRGAAAASSPSSSTSSRATSRSSGTTSSSRPAAAGSSPTSATSSATTCSSTAAAARATANELFTDLAGPDLRPAVAIRTRADVAKTIYYRRRKGTLPMLEELARDVTGWPAHAVEFFELLGWTQHLEHLRPQAAGSTCARSSATSASTARSTRRATPSTWRRSRRATAGTRSRTSASSSGGSCPTARSSTPAGGPTPWRFYFSPLGNPAPLFTRWRREGEETGLATELHVPGPIRRAFFGLDLRLHPGPPPPDFTDPLRAAERSRRCRRRRRCSDDASLFVIVDQTPVLPADIRCRRLDPWPRRAGRRCRRVDVAHGRLALGDRLRRDEPVASSSLRLPGDARRRPLRAARLARQRDVDVREYLVRTGGAAPAVPDRRRRARALAGRRPAERDDHDPRQPHLRAAGRDRAAQPRPPDHRGRERRAAAAAARTSGRLRDRRRRRRRRPIRDARRADALRAGRRGLPARRGDLGRLRLLHSHARPRPRPERGRHRAELGPEHRRRAGHAVRRRLNAQLRLELAFSVSGPIACPEHAAGIWLLDSIVDGLGGAAIAARGDAHSARSASSARRCSARVKAR